MTKNTEAENTEVETPGTGNEVYVGELTEPMLPPNLDIKPDTYSSIYDSENPDNPVMSENTDTVQPKPKAEPTSKKKEVTQKATKTQKVITYVLFGLLLFFAGFFYIQYLNVSEHYDNAIKYQKESDKHGNFREDVSALESTLAQEQQKKEKLTEIVKMRNDKFNPALLKAVTVINSSKGEIDTEKELKRVREIQDAVSQSDKIEVAQIEKYSQELTQIYTTTKAKLDEHLKKKGEDYKKAQQQNSEIAAQLEKEIAESKANLEREQAEQAERDRIAAEKAEKDRIAKEKADKEKAEQEAKDKAEEEAKKKAEEEANNKP